MNLVVIFILLAACAAQGLRAQEETPALPGAAASPAAPPAAVDPEDQAPSAGAPPAGEQPSAELIIDAEETVANEPGIPGADEPLPQLEGQLPGEQNIFGDDLFGPGEFYTPSMPEIPSAPPMIEDPREAERKMRVKFRKVRARLEGDPDLLSLKEMAERAPTPEDYRAARRSYYALFFAKVRKADKSLSKYADTLERQSVAGLYQTRIQPTVALNPPPEPQPAAKFMPPNQYPEALPIDEEPVALP